MMLHSIQLLRLNSPQYVGGAREDDFAVTYIRLVNAFTLLKP